MEENKSGGCALSVNRVRAKVIDLALLLIIYGSLGHFCGLLVSVPFYELYVPLQLLQD